MMLGNLRQQMQQLSALTYFSGEWTEGKGVRAAQTQLQ